MAFYRLHLDIALSSSFFKSLFQISFLLFLFAFHHLRACLVFFFSFLFLFSNAFLWLGYEA